MPASPPASAVGRDLLEQVRLACVPGIGPRLRRRLLERFGSPGGVFAAADADIVAVEGVGARLAAAIRTSADGSIADEIVGLCRRESIGILVDDTADYPALLSRIEDPPAPLFVRGTIEPCDALAVAIVGARHATAYGLTVAERLGGALARAGYTVVSGLARGIDAAAHRGALAAGGRTLAVLGSGVLNVYPPEHQELARRVIDSGALISEMPPLAEPRSGSFPQRNRIVSGLSLGVVVVQAAERSGALITARLAAEQGREVFAVPGGIDCRVSRGCHRLIRDGAKLVESVDDVLEEFGPLCEAATTSAGRAVRNPAELRLGELERRVLDACDTLAGDGSPGAAIDRIVDATDLTPSQVLATIVALEMRRLIRRLPGSRVARV